MDKKGIWNHIKKYCQNDYGVAGLMGNLQAESALSFDNLENAYNKKFNVSDGQYVYAVDHGTHDFINDCAGFGLAQWTYWSRKRGLLQLAKQRGVSIADPTLQLDFLQDELTGRYRGVFNIMLAATSVREASDAVLTGFENPANQSESVKQYRAKLGQAFYDEFSGGVKNTAGKYSVTASALNIRGGAGLSYNVIGSLSRGASCDIIDTRAADGYTWGMLANGRGWVAMEYLKERG